MILIRVPRSAQLLLSAICFAGSFFAFEPWGRPRVQKMGDFYNIKKIEEQVNI